MNFPYSIHNQQGVTCIDCHLDHLENTNTGIHSIADHSFKASVKTCSNCHAEQMHAAGNAVPVENEISAVEPAMVATPAVEMSSILPAPVSPLGYAGLAALIGIAAGMVLAPWLERWYKLASKKSNEDVRHDGK